MQTMTYERHEPRRTERRNTPRIPRTVRVLLVLAAMASWAWVMESPAPAPVEAEAEAVTLAQGTLEAALRVVEETEKMTLTVVMGADDIARITPGQAATFEVDALPEARFDALVRRIELASEPEDGPLAVEVELVVDNADGLLRPGMVARVVEVRSDLTPRASAYTS